MIEFVFYGACAGIALRLSWGSPPVRAVALAILFSFAVSNIIAFVLPTGYLAISDPLLQVVIGMTAASAWMVTRDRIAFAVIATSGLIVCASVAYNLVRSPEFGHDWLYVLITNILYAVQCALVGGWGYAGGWADRRTSRPVLSDLARSQDRGP